MKPSDLADFLRVQSAKGCAEFFLRHLVATEDGGAAQQIGSYRIEDKSEALDVATAIMKDARDDADDVTGPQVYALVAKLEGEEVARRRWRVAPERAFKDHAGPTEPPNMAGVLTHFMRHNEANARGSLLASAQVQDVQRQMIDALFQQNQALLAKHWEMVEAREKLATAEHERKLELMHEEKNLELRYEAVETFKPLASVLVSKLSGRKLAPHQEGLSTLDTLLGSIRKSQLDGLIASLQANLDPPQVATFFKLYDEATERVAALEKAKADAANEREKKLASKTEDAPSEATT